MTTPALRHFLEHALEAHAPGVADALPACYDWQRLCRDVPAMVERVSKGRFEAADRADAKHVQALADIVFRTAYVVAIAVLCAADEDTPDPEGTLADLGQPPDEEVECRFDRLVAEVLDGAEAFFADSTVTLDERGEEVHRLHALAWPHAAEYVLRLDAVDGLGSTEEGEGPNASGVAAATVGVLLGVGRLAVLLAGFRWMAGTDGGDRGVA